MAAEVLWLACYSQPYVYLLTGSVAAHTCWYGCRNEKHKVSRLIQPVRPGHEAALETYCSLCAFSSRREENGDKSEPCNAFRLVGAADFFFPSFLPPALVGGFKLSKQIISSRAIFFIVEQQQSKLSLKRWSLSLFNLFHKQTMCFWVRIKKKVVGGPLNCLCDFVWII